MTDIWDTEAELLAEAHGKSIDECREAVILKWLMAGDVVEMEIEGLGKLTNTIVADESEWSILKRKKILI